LSTIAVGQRVFVNCPGDRRGTVSLVDETGQIFSAVHLTDGAEVEVVAWRPRVGSDAHYRVRVSSSGADGWLPAGNLRKVLVPIPPAERAAAPVAPSVDAGGTRFGQRPHVRRPPTASAASTAPAAPGVPGGGKRFGQYFEADRAPASSTNTKPSSPIDSDGGRRFGQR
jgi:hypothetical protein